MSEQQLVTVTREGGVATVSMNRPPVNAIAPDLLEQFDAAFAELGGDSSVRVIVVTSAIPRYFMAGADIKMMAAATPQGGENALQNSPFSIVERTPKPVIAAVNGHALGGGCELALCCDYRLMLDDGRSTIGLTETSLGIIPGAGGTQRLPRLVGRARGLHMIFEGTRLTAPDALQIGLVDAALAPDDFENWVQTKANVLSKMATRALASAKRAVLEGMEMSLADGLRLERELFFEVVTTPDAAEGLGAFIEKRPANFTGA
ncbi:MAG TPA: enoyl-CoA hydratase-related protein [Candidatus Dormibacteraeota bacterium]|jgi:enoyl-CoA hydratase|nr:enoyl-CoA hydratase-related protein [Candidatus Dormibacteraeota bacterium]